VWLSANERAASPGRESFMSGRKVIPKNLKTERKEFDDTGL